MDSKSNVVHVDFARAKKAPSSVEQQKFEAFCELIEQGMVMVTLDARCAGVSVPPYLAQEADLRLNFSHRFQVRDFAYDAEGVRASLSFPEGIFYCNVPWTAVLAIRSHVRTF